VTGDPAAASLAELLAAVAGRRHEGVLVAPGRRDEIHLRGGRITHVSRQGPGHPGAGPPAARRGDVPPGPALAARESFLDAVREYLDADPAASRWRQARGRRPLDSSGVSLSVAVVLAEAARRRDVLDRLEEVVTPETPLTRPAELPDAAVRITPEQWAVLSQVDGPTTPRELAAALGDSVFRSVCRAYELLRLGLLAGPAATARVRYGTHPLFISGYA
jgi:hypothetical protein